MSEAIHGQGPPGPVTAEEQRLATALAQAEGRIRALEAALKEASEVLDGYPCTCNTVSRPPCNRDQGVKLARKLDALATKGTAP